MFSTAFGKILGKPFGDLPEETKEFNNGLMYEFNMNYSTPQAIAPHSSALFHKEEHAFIHEWSITSSGKFYGLNRLKEVMTLKEFMTMPACVVEELIDGVTEGNKQRFALDEQNTPKEGTDKLTAENRKLIEEAKRAGLI